MKILQNGEEVKDATVIYDTTGRPDSIRIKGVFYDINAFELVDTDTVEKTKKAPKKTTKTAISKATAKKK